MLTWKICYLLGLRMQLPRGDFMDVNISIGYEVNKTLYKDVEISFGMGEINHVIGENGTGKSTLYKTLIGELKPLGGTVPDEVKKILQLFQIIYHSLQN